MSQGLWQAVLTRIVSKKSALTNCHPSRQPVLQGPYAAKGAFLPCQLCVKSFAQPRKIGTLTVDGCEETNTMVKSDR